MATLERSRQPSQESAHGVESPWQNVLLEGGTSRAVAEAVTGVGAATIFPPVPTHDPSQSFMGNGERQSEYQSMEEAVSQSLLNTDEIEEVLEELRDDEDMLETRDDISSYEEQDTIETDMLIQLAQSECIAAIQSLLRGRVSSATSATWAGVDELRRMTTAADMTAIKTSPPTLPSSSEMQTERDEEAIKLVSLLKSDSLLRLDESDARGGANILFTLRDLLASLTAVKTSAMSLRSHLQTVGASSSGQMRTQAPLSSPQESSSGSSASLPYQHPRSPRTVGYHRSNSASGPSNLLLLSPAKSRVELRDPFADIETRSQSAMSEERTRERSDHEGEASVRLSKVLIPLEKRSSEIISTLGSSQLVASSAETSVSEVVAPVASVDEKERLVGLWKYLHLRCVNLQRLLDERKRSSLSISTGIERRKGSASPSTYSPSYSPARSRSRRNSLSSVLSGTASSLEAGDPTGEAINAGVGVGPTRSLSRLSTHGTSSIPVWQVSSSPLLDSLGLQRERTRSDGTASNLLHSPPPRYSEESLRHWSGFATGTAPEVETRSHTSGRESLGDVSNASTRILPAYNVNEAPYAYADDMHKGSTSSLSKFDRKDLLPSDDKDRGRSRSINNVASDEPQTSYGAATEYHARTSQDLSMIQASIDRLYTAVPQLNDQRAMSPRDPKQRQADRQEEVMDLLERMAKGGRMEDQRAPPPSCSSPLRRHMSVATSPDGHIDAGAASSSQAGVTSPNARLTRRLGSISLGSLSMRRSSAALGADAKGKEKEKTGVTNEGIGSNSLHKLYEADLTPLADHLQAANNRSYNDQRAETALRSRPGSKPAKLDLTGVSNLDTSQEDDALFAALESTISSGRMANQDAVRKPQSSSVAAMHTSSRQQSPSEATFTLPPPFVAELSPLPVSALTAVSLGESEGSSKQETIAASDTNDRVTSDASLVRSLNFKFQTSVRYLAESQPCLGSLSVMVWMEPAIFFPATPLSYRTFGEESQVLVSYLHSTASCNLPTQVEQTSGAQQAVWAEDHWQVKLRMLDDNRARRNPQLAAAPLNASTLQSMLPEFFVCNGCLKPIAETKDITEYLPLPSQHWEELVDAWMCHTDQELNHDMIETQKRLDTHEGLQEVQCRISDALVIVHPKCLVAGAQEDDSVRMRLRCNDCNSTLGERAVSGAVKFFKYAIRPKKSTANTDTVPPSLLGMVIANDLIRLSQAHATRHFLIQDDENGKSQLVLWLFLESFDLTMSGSTHFESLLPVHGSDYITTLACKIMYRDPTRQGSSSTLQSQAAWAQTDLVEHLSYPIEVCHQLQEQLHHSTLSYPPSRRRFGTDWSVGYLRVA